MYTVVQLETLVTNLYIVIGYERRIVEQLTDLVEIKLVIIHIFTTSSFVDK